MPPATAAIALWKSKDRERWEDLRARHADLSRRHGVASRDPAKLKTLAELDAFVATELPATIRAPPHDAKLLVRLVQWKLLRGKFRPALLGYAKAQTDAAVGDAFARALAALGTEASSPPLPSPPPSPAQTRAALDALCSLRGVGPATASIVLCAATSGHLPYMGDEALEAAVGARTYKADEYLALASALQARAAELAAAAAAAAAGGRGGGGGRDWTAEDVQRALHAAELEARAGGAGGGGGGSSGGRAAAAAAAGGGKKQKKAAAVEKEEAKGTTAAPKRQRRR